MKKIIIASSNEGKIKEFKALLHEFDFFSLKDFFNGDIEENGNSFKQNALIKSRTVFDSLSTKDKKDFIVLSDDSGLCVEALNGNPGVFSARFSKQGSDEANRKKLITELKNLNLSQSKAYFQAFIGLCCVYGEFCASGVLRGYVLSEQRGENGFGYDSLFIPNGFDKTLAELSFEEKNLISHRKKALQNIIFLLRLFEKD